jgi:hypothetical protein
MCILSSGLLGVVKAGQIVALLRVQIPSILAHSNRRNPYRSSSASIDDGITTIGILISIQRKPLPVE